MRLQNLTEERKKEAGSRRGVELKAMANPDSRIDVAPVARCGPRSRCEQLPALKKARPAF